MYLFPSHPNGYSQARGRPRAGTSLVWFVTALLGGAAALAPVYLHLNGTPNLSVHTTAPDTPHAGMNHTVHDTLAHDTLAHATPHKAVPTLPEPGAPAPKHEHKGHAFCFSCVVLMMMSPSLVSLVRTGLPRLGEVHGGEPEPRLKVYVEFDAQPRAPPSSST